MVGAAVVVVGAAVVVVGAAVVVVGAAVVVVTGLLHKSVVQQVGPLLMVPTFTIKGRVPRLEAAAHVFWVAQPSAGYVVDPFVTED